MCASLLVSGCALPARQTMSSMDLDYFQVDCTMREQQIRLLQSMRQDTDDRLANGVVNMTNPWDAVLNPDAYAQRSEIHRGRTNWLINQHLRRLARDCS